MTSVRTTYVKVITLVALNVGIMAVSGCKYYGSNVVPEHPISMDEALNIANNQGVGTGLKPVIRHPTRPKIDRPSYLPEKELALVAPPKTLLLWTYPHITDDNTRVFGSWSTIFLTDKYEWTQPTNELPIGEDDTGAPAAGRPNMGADVSTLPAEAVPGPKPTTVKRVR